MTAVASSHGADRLGSASALTGGYSAAFLGAAGIAAAGALLTAVLLRIPRPTAVESDHALAKERVAA